MKMSKSEKKNFIKDLMNNVEEDIVNQVDEMPEDWDGWELRQLISDRVNESVLFREMPKGRKEEYENTRIVKNI